MFATPGDPQVREGNPAGFQAFADEEDEDEISDFRKASEPKKRKKESVDVMRNSSDTPPNMSQAAVLTKVTKAQRFKTLKLSEIPKPMDPEERDRTVTSAVSQILKTERCSSLGGVASVRNKILTLIAAHFDENIGDAVKEFILEDLKSRTDLAFAWLYEEYSFMQGFSRIPSFLRSQVNPPESYNRLLCCMIQSLLEKPDAKDRDMRISMASFTSQSQ
ncbi:symplekin-like [Hetaerina americana]|uniref:symplekin-like n=1 Tax=Hetaerina americana TaxID=62018 RepID=UPI003A7F6199